MTRESYMTLCDLLVVFGRQLRSCGQLSALVYSPDPSLQQLLQVLMTVCCVYDEIEVAVYRTMYWRR